MKTKKNIKIAKKASIKKVVKKKVVKPTIKKKKASIKKVVKPTIKKKAAAKFKSFDEWWQNVAQKKVEKIENKWLKENEPNDPEDDGGGDHWHVNEMMHGGDASEMTYEIAREAWENIASGEVWEFGQESSLYCELDDIIIEAAKEAKR